MEEIVERWKLKVKKVLKVTPRILGFFSRGRVEPLFLTWGWRLDWFLQSGVKRVTVDLLGAMERPFEEAQSAMEVRWEFMDSTDWGMLREELRSSA